MPEIIINDVDVSGCEYLTRVLHNCKIQGVYSTSNTPCECNPVCHYKRWQQEKQENEILNEKLQIAMRKNANKTIEGLEKLNLQAENGYLKEQVSTLQLADDIKKQEIDSLREANERLEEGCKVWQQTLERNHYMKDNEVVRLEREKQQLLDECVNEKEKTHDLYLISQKYEKALKDIGILATKDVSIANFVQIQTRILEVLQ